MVVEGSHENRGLLPSSTSVRLLKSSSPPRDRHLPIIHVFEKAEVTVDLVHPRCAGIDISKRDAKVCVRVASAGRAKATSTVTTWGSVTNQVLALREHLVAEQVTLVVMEATSDYWKPFYYLLEDGPFEVMLVNARHVRNLPGRKSDVSDAGWLAQLGAHGLVRGSFVPPEPIRQLRDLTRKIDTTQYPATFGMTNRSDPAKAIKISGNIGAPVADGLSAGELQAKQLGRGLVRKPS